MRMLNAMRVWAQAGVVSLGFATSAVACAFHSYTPDPTLVDILMGSEHAVLAQPDPANPYYYTPVAALIGSTDGVVIPDPLDDKTLARLKQNPSATVLFARDGPYGPWLKLAVLDDRYRAVIDTVIGRKDSWSLGGDEDRYQVFAGLVNDANPDIRRLALLELDRADYSLLREMRLPKVASLRADLEAGDPDLRPIRILLAGLSHDKRLVQIVSDGLDSAARRDVAYLGAYATALVELGGADSVGYIIERFLAPDALTVATREKIIEALAIHSQTGETPVKRAVRSGLTNLLGERPELAAAVARQFGFRSDWSLAKPLRAAAAARPPSEIADVFSINQYLAIAEQKTQ